MAKHIKTCDAKPNPEVDPKIVTETTWYKEEFETTSAKTAEMKHKVEVSYIFILPIFASCYLTNFLIRVIANNTHTIVIFLRGMFSLLGQHFSC